MIPRKHILIGMMMAVCAAAGPLARRANAQSAPATQITPSNDTGTNPFGSYSTDAGNINLANGNLSLQIPLLSLPGRNGLNLVLTAQYDSKIWTPSAAYNGGSDITYTWKAEKKDKPLGALGWQLSWPSIHEGPFIYDQAGNLVGHGDYIVTLPNGGKHNLGALSPFLDSEDGSFLRINSYNPNDVLVYEKNGTVIHFPGASSVGTSANKIEDTDGNYISTNANGIVDTLGRQITLTYTTYGLTGISYQDSNGNTQTVTLNYTALTLMSTTQGQYYTPTPPFALPAPSTCPTCKLHVWVNQPARNFSYWMLTSIVLPSGKSYSFTYNGYGELTKIQYPTGGYTGYDYGAFTHHETYWLDFSLRRAGDFREVTTRRICRDPSGVCGGGGTPEDVTTFGPTVGATTPNNSKMDVVDPAGYRNHYEFSQVSLDSLSKYYSPRELLHQVYSDTGALLRTIQTDYTTLDNGWYADVRLLPLRVTTTLNDSPGTPLVSKVEYVYDTFTSTVMYPPYYPEGAIDYGDQSAQQKTRDVDNPAQILEYAYGSGTPGGLLRKTTAAWLHVQGIVDYVAQYHILDRKTNHQVLDASANKLAETQYEYDSFTEGLTASGAVQHDTAYGTNNTYRGKLTAIKRWRNTDGALLTTRFQYDDAGNGRKMVDPLNHPTTMGYADSWGNTACTPAGGSAAAYLTSVSDALTHVTTAAYNSCTGTMVSITDPNSQQTAFPIYDNMGRLLRTTNPDGGQLGRAYFIASTPFSVTTTKKLDATRNIVSQLFVDGLARTTQTILCEDGAPCAQKTYTLTAYDGLGRTSTSYNPTRCNPPATNCGESTWGYTTSTYDALNRVKNVIPPDGSTGLNNISTVYAGNCTTVTDQAGKTRKSCGDALGRLTQVFEDPAASNYETDYQYDTLDNLTRVDQKGNDLNSANWRTRTFTYNSLSQLLTATNPESGAITYTYNDDGTLVTKTSPAPNQTGAATVTTTYAYDALHRLTGKTYSNGDPAVTYTYDQPGCLGQPTCYNIGRRTSMSDAAGSEAWSYDKMGRPLTDQRTTAGITKNTSYTYNLDGSLASLTYPSGRTITYMPDAAGRTVSAVDSTGPINYATAATYAPQGALASVQNGSSLSSTYIFNNRLQPCWLYATTGTPLPATTLCTATAATASLLDFKYDFSLGTADNGNVTSITNNRDTTRSQSFTYDALNRIATAFTSGNLWGETFQIDPWGNLNKILPYTGKPQPENLNQLAGPNNRFTGMSYDAPGNLLNDGASNYTYDAENKIKIGANVTYTYDGDGRRVKKSNGKLYWYGMGSDPITETDAAGNNPVEYVFFGGKRIARRDSAGAISYYFADHLGSSRVVTSSTGTILDDSDFYPFGGERVVTSSSGNTYKFTGKERDSESGLDNFGARYDSSSLGRFMSPDPLGGHLEDPQTLNRYVYVRNNPLRFTDPTGLDFYLTCTQTKDNASTCRGGHQGTTTTDANGKSTFTATVISNDKDGNLADQNGNKYSGTFDGKRVSFTLDGSKQSSTGEWKQDSNATAGITGTGALNNFDFTFKNHNAAQSLYAEWTFKGTSEQAGSALEKAGFVHWAVGFHFGKTEYRSPCEARCSVHFNVGDVTRDPQSNVPRTSGDMHNNEYYPKYHPLDHFWHDVLQRP